MLFFLGMLLISTAQSGRDRSRSRYSVDEFTDRNIHYTTPAEILKGMKKHYLDREPLNYPSFGEADELFETFMHGYYEFTYNKHRFSPPDKDYKIHAKGHGDYHGYKIYWGLQSGKTRMRCHHHVFVKEPAYKKRDDYNQTSAYCDCLLENGITTCDLEKDYQIAQNSDKLLYKFKAPMKINSSSVQNLQKRETDWYIFLYVWIKEESIPCFWERYHRQPIIDSLTDIFMRFFKEGGEGACAKIIHQVPAFSIDCSPMSIMLKVHPESNGEAALENDNDLVCQQADDFDTDSVTGRPW